MSDKYKFIGCNYKPFMNTRKWEKSFKLYGLKGAQVWDFDVLDFNDFFIMKSLEVGDLRAKIKVLNFLQMGEILAILF